MVRGMVWGFVALLVGMAAPVAVADVIVDTTTVTATEADGAITAKVPLINTSDQAVTLTPSVDPSGCSIAPTRLVLAPFSSSKPALTLTDCFTATRTEVTVDLDGTGPAAAVKVTGPDSESDWMPLWWGALIGLVLAVLVALWGVTQHQDVRATATAPERRRIRGESYAAVWRIVDARMGSLPGGPLRWKKLDPPTYDMTSPLGNLEAGWSFKDSWVSNITVASTALIALLTSTDALTAVLGEEPEAALGVMTVGGLLAAVLIGIANTAVKLVGDSASEVTVGGLILSTALVVLGAGLEVGTVGMALALALDGVVPIIATGLLAIVVAAVLVLYAFRSLSEAITKGFTDSLPTVPADAVEKWAASGTWDKLVVATQIRTTYDTWLEPGPAAPPTATAGMAPQSPVQLRPVWTEPQAASLL